MVAAFASILMRTSYVRQNSKIWHYTIVLANGYSLTLALKYFEPFNFLI